MLLALGLLFQSTSEAATPEEPDESVVFAGDGSGQILLLMRHQKLSNRYPVSSR